MLAVVTAAHTPKSLVTSATAWALVRVPSVPWSGLKGTGAVHTSGVPAPLTISGPAACTGTAVTAARAPEQRAKSRGPRIHPVLRNLASELGDLREEAVQPTWAAQS